MSSYLESTFRPRAAQPGEVTLVIPNIFNPSETLPVHVKQDELFNIYMSLFGDPDKKPEGEELATSQRSSSHMQRPDFNMRSEW